MNKNNLFLLLLCLTCGNLSFGQKFEREYRIKVEEVPDKARRFIEALNFDRKVKWYGEEGLNSKSIEAKTKYLGRKYSVEFDTSGHIEDIEIRIPTKAIPAKTLKSIKSNLDEEFESFRFIKIQVQYSGEPEALIRINADNWKEALVNKKYEIVLKGKTEAETRWYEYTFSEIGEVEGKSVVILRNTDNLEY